MSEYNDPSRMTSSSGNESCGGCVAIVLVALVAFSLFGPLGLLVVMLAAMWSHKSS